MSCVALSFLRAPPQAELGREVGGLRWGPRPLDLDIIFYDSISCDEDGLQVPHPRWHERSFVQVGQLLR